MNDKPQRNWVCPRCSKGVRGPSAPHRDSLVRWCLPCSEATGRLVERTCPALDANRTRRKEKRLEAAKRKRATNQRRTNAAKRQTERNAFKRRAAREEVAGDLNVELARLWPIALKHARRENFPTKLPALGLHTGAGDVSTGHAWWEEHRLHVTVAVRDDVAGVYGTLAHEVAHMVQGEGDDRYMDGVHGRGFWIVLIAIIADAYETEINIAEVMAERSVWSKQCAIEHSIREARGYS